MVSKPVQIAIVGLFCLNKTWLTFLFMDPNPPARPGERDCAFRLWKRGGVCQPEMRFHNLEFEHKGPNSDSGGSAMTR